MNTYKVRSDDLRSAKCFIGHKKDCGYCSIKIFLVAVLQTDFKGGTVAQLAGKKLPCYNKAALTSRSALE